MKINITKCSFKYYRHLRQKLSCQLSTLYTRFILTLNGVHHNKIICFGRPFINLSLNGKLILGNNLKLRSYSRYSDTGENRPSKLIVHGNGVLTIGNNVGITSSLICCWQSITIGDNVKIGGGNQIFDTNYHSIDSALRNSNEDKLYTKTAPIRIGDNVFIGTACIICKGVSIGNNSIIAAGSVVTKDIPANEIWGGNPASFIRKI